MSLLSFFICIVVWTVFHLGSIELQCIFTPKLWWGDRYFGPQLVGIICGAIGFLLAGFILINLGMS